MYGYTGNILRVDLTNQTLATLNTRDYADWVGGHGIATAIFFDLMKDKTVSAFDPRNTLVMVSGLFAGTSVPAASRMEMVGIQSQSYPYEWFGRSSIGGNFPVMLKFAGFDGIVIEGAAEKPTWINIVDGNVEFKDAMGLWGLDTHETQRVIFSKVSEEIRERNRPTKETDSATQWPCVLAIGPAGENRSRIATIQHSAGPSFGQGGFGGIWGSKKLKAISVYGTGNIDVADPEGLLNVVLEFRRKYGADFEHPKISDWQEYLTSHFGGHPGKRGAIFDNQRRPHGCYGCHMNCRPRTSTGIGTGGICKKGRFYQRFEVPKHGRITEISGKATLLADKLGINAYAIDVDINYLRALRDKGILGPGRKIDTDLPFDKLGEAEFIEDFLHGIAYRKGIGNLIAEGMPRAAEQWGRLEEDLATGTLEVLPWGYPIHYDPRTEVYWGYASLVSSRDINCHDFNVISYWIPNLDVATGKEPFVSAEQAAEIIAEKCAPYHDPRMIDFSNDNLYSIHMARTTAWLLHYSLFWKQSCGLCDNAFADFVNPYSPDHKGLTPEGEMAFFKAVTGKDIRFTDTMEIGRKMFALNRAIWTLQGRHRDMEKFHESVYSVPSQGVSMFAGQPPSYFMPVNENGRWTYKNIVPRHLDRNRVEEWKTIFYELEGWDIQTGWPLKKTLEDLGLQGAAEELQKAGKLPAGDITPP
jgi:aldehyde:ferredoxin oxidoreductase